MTRFDDDGPSDLRFPDGRALMSRTGGRPVCFVDLDRGEESESFVGLGKCKVGKYWSGDRKPCFIEYR